jgi:hypothetical protein
MLGLGTGCDSFTTSLLSLIILYFFFLNLFCYFCLPLRQDTAAHSLKARIQKAVLGSGP